SPSPAGFAICRRRSTREPTVPSCPRTRLAAAMRSSAASSARARRACPPSSITSSAPRSTRSSPISKRCPPPPRVERPRRNAMQTHQSRVVAPAAATPFAGGGAARAADHLLSGTVASAAGEKLGGVPVSAKAQGSTIPPSVYTDERGGYYFPPLPAGTYTVWAQALAFELAKGEVDLTAARRADLTLPPMTDVERQGRQKAGAKLTRAAPPGDTPPPPPQPR